MPEFYKIFEIERANDNEMDPDKYRFNDLSFAWKEGRENRFLSREEAKLAIRDSPSLKRGWYVIVEVFEKP